MATVRKKVDNRIRVQIENGVALQHRTMFVVVGDRGRDQVNLLTLRYAKYCIVMTLMSAAGCPPASHVVQSHCQSSPLCSLVLQKRSRLQQVCDDEYFTHQALYFCVYLYIQCYYRTFVEYVLATAKSA